MATARLVPSSPPPTSLTTILATGVEGLLQYLRHGGSVSPEELAWAALHPDWRIRRGVARHIRTPTAVINQLVKDDYMRVWQPAIHHPALGDEGIAYLLAWADAEKQVELARRAALAPWVAGALAAGSEEVATALAHRTDLAVQVQHVLAVRPTVRQTLIAALDVLAPDIESVLARDMYNHRALMARSGLRWSTLVSIAQGPDPELAGRAADQITARAAEFAAILAPLDLAPLFESQHHSARQAGLVILGLQQPTPGGHSSEV